jgi:hypothetical protein
VIPPGTDVHLRRLLDRALHGIGMRVKLVQQDEPRGPGDALYLGVREAGVATPILVLLADTYLDTIPPLDGDWVGVRRTTEQRQWCVVETAADGTIIDFVDRRPVASGGDQVAVGLYHFADGLCLSSACRGAIGAFDDADSELQISAILRQYSLVRTMHFREIVDWHDCGDVRSMATARRQHVNLRSPASVTVDSTGILTKTGGGPAFKAQIDFWQHLSDSQRLMMPRLIDADPASTWYRTEFLDLPTLADIYLYAPVQAALWAELLRAFICDLRQRFWPGEGIVETGEMVKRCREMYIAKMERRLAQWGHPILQRDELVVNGRAIPAGAACVARLAGRLEGLLSFGQSARIHGDLHFSNILYSLPTLTFRLIDPRGDFGGATAWGDERYDLAKLRHSYAGMYDAVVHDLFELTTSSRSYIDLAIGPAREPEISAMDEVLRDNTGCLDDIRAIEASLFLSMVPLHRDSPRRQLALYVRGLELAESVLA